MSNRTLRGRGMMLGVVAAIAIAGPAYASIGPVQVPTVQAPVPVPTVQVPVPVPTVQLPVPVPTVRVPVPTAPPSVPAPSVPAPSVRVPSVPGVTGGSGSSGRGGAAGGSSGAASGGSSGGASGGSSGGAPSGGGSTGVAPASGGGGSRSGAARRGGSAAPAPDPATARRRIRIRDTHLRQAVEQRRSCLGKLPAPQERVLRLRAGIGPGEPLSRARVAGRLDTTLRRVARLERAGLHRLRGLCGGAAAASIGAAPAPARVGTSTTAVRCCASDVGGGEFVARASGVAKPGGAERSGSDGAPRSSAGKSNGGGVAGESQTVLASRGNEPGAIGVIIPLVLLALAATVWALARSRRRDAEPAAGTAGPPPPDRSRPPLPPSAKGPGWAETPPSGTAGGSGWSAGARPAAPPPAPDEAPGEPRAPGGRRR